MTATIVFKKLLSVFMIVTVFSTMLANCDEHNLPESELNRRDINRQIKALRGEDLSHDEMMERVEEFDDIKRRWDGEKIGENSNDEAVAVHFKLVIPRRLKLDSRYDIVLLSRKNGVYKGIKVIERVPGSAPAEDEQGYEYDDPETPTPTPTFTPTPTPEPTVAPSTPVTGNGEDLETADIHAYEE